jgi:hypothetical protein
VNFGLTFKLRAKTLKRLIFGAQADVHFLPQTWVPDGWQFREIKRAAAFSGRRKVRFVAARSPAAIRLFVNSAPGVIG